MAKRDPYRQHGRNALCACGHVDTEIFTTCSSCRPHYLRAAARRARHAGKQEAAALVIDRHAIVDAIWYDDFCTRELVDDYLEPCSAVAPSCSVALATIGDALT